VIGNPGTTTVEQITQMSLWCLTKAPLIISTDLRNASNTTIDILTNAQAIAVNQDSLGVPGKLAQRTEAGGQVWTGELSGGRYAAVLVNTLNTTDQLVALDWSLLPGEVAATTRFLVNDVWNNTGGDLGQHAGSISLNVLPHGSRMIVLRPSSSPTPPPPPSPPPSPPPTPPPTAHAAAAHAASSNTRTFVRG
jgi:alpha-galactosidase